MGFCCGVRDGGVRDGGDRGQGGNLSCRSDCVVDSIDLVKQFFTRRLELVEFRKFDVGLHQALHKGRKDEMVPWIFE